MFNNHPFFFFNTLIDALRHTDWGAAAARGPLALVAEFFRALLGLNAWPFFVPLESGWRLETIRPLLDANGIESWGWGKSGGELFFQVKLRQASWAQYLLQQNGVPISGQLLDEGARSAYRPAARRSLRPAPGATPTARPATTPPPANPALQPEKPASLLKDPIGQINRAVDRLAKW